MDKKLFSAMLFLSATGLASGCFFEIYLSGNDKTQLISLLSGFFSTGGNGLSFISSFWQNFRSNLLFLFLCFISPLIPVIIPLNLLLLFTRGMALGFSAAMLMETFGAKGIIYAALTLVPCGILLILLYAFMISISVHQSVSIIGCIKLPWTASAKKHSRKALHHSAGPYLYTYAAVLVLMIIICLLQVFLLQTVT